MNYYRVSKNSKKYKKNMKGGFELTREAGNRYTSAERTTKLENYYEELKKSRGRTERRQKQKNIETIILRYVGIFFGFIFLIVSTVLSFNKENGFEGAYIWFYSLGVLPYAFNDFLLIKKGKEKGIKNSIIYATIIILIILILINLVNASRFLSIYQNLENHDNTYGSRLIEIQKKNTSFIIGISFSCVFLIIAIILLIVNFIING